MARPVVSFVNGMSDLCRPPPNPFAIRGHTPLPEIRSGACPSDPNGREASQCHGPRPETVRPTAVPRNVARRESDVGIVRRMIGQSVDSEPLSDGDLACPAFRSDTTRGKTFLHPLRFEPRFRRIGFFAGSSNRPDSRNATSILAERCKIISLVETRVDARPSGEFELANPKVDGRR